MMVDFKFDALAIQLSPHKEPHDVGLVKKLKLEVYIGGWSSVCQPYIVSLNINFSQETTFFGGCQKLTSAMKLRPEN